MTTDEHLTKIRNRASTYSFSREGDALAAEQLAKDVKWLLEQLTALREVMENLLASDGEGRSITAYKARHLMDQS